VEKVVRNKSVAKVSQDEEDIPFRHWDEVWLGN
jgi:hypothetical protein